MIFRYNISFRNKGLIMGIKRVPIDQSKFKSRGSDQKREILEVAKQDVIDSYNRGHSITNIANVIDAEYKNQMEEESLFSPSEKKRKNVKPTIGIYDIRKVLKKEGLI